MAVPRARSARAPRAAVSEGRAAPVPVGAVRLVERAAAQLSEAVVATDPGERFVLAHLAALRAGAAVVAARQVPGRRRGPVNVWESLVSLAPELEGWTRYFGGAAERRAAVDSGRGPAVTAHEADAHLVQAEAFAVLVAELLDARVWPGGLPLVAS